MHDFIRVRKQFDPLVHDPGVGDQIQGLVPKKGDQGFIINSQHKLGEA